MALLFTQSDIIDEETTNLEDGLCSVGLNIVSVDNNLCHSIPNLTIKFHCEMLPVPYLTCDKYSRLQMQSSFNTKKSKLKIDHEFWEF